MWKGGKNVLYGGVVLVKLYEECESVWILGGVGISLCCGRSGRSQVIKFSFDFMGNWKLEKDLKQGSDSQIGILGRLFGYLA